MPILRTSVQLQSILFSLVFVLLLLPFCLSRENITFGHPISDNVNEKLVSANRRFELGFFTPVESSNAKRYVGMWYYNYPSTIVWVLNRDQHLSTNNGFFGFDESGKIAVWDSSQKIWPSGQIGKVSSNGTLRLMDTGNLVLSEGREVLWQSFDHPTDTFIPGMLWSETFKLTSWYDHGDPKPGNFTFRVDPDRDDQYAIRKKELSLSYWKSGVYGDTDSMIGMIKCLLSKSSCSSATYYGHRLYNFNYNYTRLVMHWTGQIQFYVPNNDSVPVNMREYRPKDVCDIFNYCGNYGSCNSKNGVPCKCLPGSEPTSADRWSEGDFSDGCTRKQSGLCDAKDFMSFKKMKAGSPQKMEAQSEEECKNNCLGGCTCQAYYYSLLSSPREGLESTERCWTWSSELNNILEQTENDYNLNFRIKSTDPKRRACKVCGTNVLPYPLSTGEKCGDRLYAKFSCDNETSQLYFTTSSNEYRVTSITPEENKFTINLNNNTSCASNDLLKETLQIDHSRQFNLTGLCKVFHSTFPQGQPLYEVEIEWSTPSAPSCTSNSDCKDWPCTTCNAGKKTCHCNTNPSWNPSIPCCSPEQPSRSSSNKKSFYLIALATVALLIFIVGFSYYRSRRPENENREGIQGNPVYRLNDSEQRIKEWISSNQFQEEDKKDIDVPFFDFESILAATDNFSDKNKLGRGGFGPVYKGSFPGGQEIAIKRLSSTSGQGLEEFKNEVILIAKLQHRNLVRLLGYCIEGEEKMLLYEYMPNGSLDSFIFDRTRCLLLTWELRFEIILGIARGMLYLHQDSRLRIIHRDMKSSNVLLDEEMNPKISDFGLARIFENKQTEATTKRVIGTYGYMSPEYALDGFFSFKSDVFSYGVVVLEIISGKRNTAFYRSIGTLNLVSHAWKFWSENNALNLMDRSLREACNASEVSKCINVALLCVQEDPIDRPTMSNVLFMLASESASLPAPKKPGFAVNRSLSTTSSSSKPESVYEISTTAVQGR